MCETPCTASLEMTSWKLTSGSEKQPKQTGCGQRAVTVFHKHVGKPSTQLLGTKVTVLSVTVDVAQVDAAKEKGICF